MVLFISVVRLSRKKVQFVLMSCEFGSESKYSSVSLEISFLSLYQSADLYLNTLWGGFLFRIGLRFTSNVTASWSLMTGVVCVLVMMDGLEVSMRSRMLPDSMRVGSFTIFCNPNSLIISSSLLCLLAVLVFVVCWLSQSMSGRLKSPANITTLGVFFCDLYSFVRDAWRASSDATSWPASF